MKSYLQLILSVAIVMTLNDEFILAAPSEVKAYKDVVFATVGKQALKLDVSVPTGVKNPPLVVYIHGGGWRKGSYKHNRMKWLPEHGFACASISYRLTDVAVFPAQIYDCKAAVRFLRAKASIYGYDATRIAVAGGSAGGHLALLMGTSGGVKALEGDVGEHRGQSSSVQAIVNYFGPSDFILRAKTQPATVDTPDRGSFKLLDGDRTGKIDFDLAKQASPTTYVAAGDPPLLTLHGDADKTVLLDQAKRIHDLYLEHNLTSELVVVPKAGHGGKTIFNGGNRQKAINFLKKYLAPPSN